MPTYMINLWRHVSLVRWRKLEPSSISKQWNFHLWMIRHVRGHVKLQPRSQAVIFVPFTMAASSGYNNSDVVIVAAGRTPIGNLNGCLSSLKAHELGAMVIRDVLTRGNTPASDVAEVIMGQVCTAGRCIHDRHSYESFLIFRKHLHCVGETHQKCLHCMGNLQSFGIPRAGEMDQVYVVLLCACHAPLPTLCLKNLPFQI